MSVKTDSVYVLLAEINKLCLDIKNIVVDLREGLEDPSDEELTEANESSDEEMSGYVQEYQPTVPLSNSRTSASRGSMSSTKYRRLEATPSTTPTLRVQAHNRLVQTNGSPSTKAAACSDPNSQSNA